MSGRNVATIYRQVIENTIQASKADFDENGIDQEVLDTLKAAWESKLAVLKNDNHIRQPTASTSELLSPASRSKQDNKPKIKKADQQSRSQAAQTDEIGSDLDDSDDDVAEVDQIDASADGGDFMIALYDKVTRVKNKWKVSLRDGVISVNDKDYLFSRCQGEFEW